MITAASALFTLYFILSMVDYGGSPGLEYYGFIVTTYFSGLLSSVVIYRISPTHPLAGYPGPPLWNVSSLVLAYISLRGDRHLVLERLHRKYGPFVRIGKRLCSSLLR